MSTYSGVAAALLPHTVRHSGGIADLFYQAPQPLPTIVPILVHVSYDLNAPGQNYGPLIDMLERCGALRIQRSAWLLHWYGHIDACTDVVHSVMDQTDSLLVAQISGAIRGYESNPELRAKIQWMLNQARLG